MPTNSNDEGKGKWEEVAWSIDDACDCKDENMICLPCERRRLITQALAQVERETIERIRKIDAKVYDEYIRAMGGKS